MRPFSDLKSLAVVGADGRVIGKVEDLQLELPEWRVTGLVVKLEKDAAKRLGRHKTFGAPSAILRVDHVKAISQTVVLHETLEELAHAVAEHEEPGAQAH